MNTSTPTIIKWLLVITFFTRIALAFRPEIKLTERPYQDDGYYALTCGYQLAAGHGYSVDGVHPTNGVQPLLIPLYAFFFIASGMDKWLGVRLTFILVALIDCFCVYALFRMVKCLRYTPINNSNSRKVKAEFIAPILWTFLFQSLLITACGLETGLYIAIMLGSIWQYVYLKKREEQFGNVSAYHWMFFGITLGLLVLARIDAVFIVIAFALIELMRRNGRFIHKIYPVILFSFTAFIITLPWWIYNYYQFGSLMPISGQSEAFGNLLPLDIRASIGSLCDLMPIVISAPLGNASLSTISIVLGSYLLIIYYVNKKFAILRTLRRQYRIFPIAPVFVAGIIFIIYYTFFFNAPQFMARYFYPIRVAWMLIFSLTVPILWEYIRNFSSHSKRNKRFISIIIIIGIIGVMSFHLSSYIRNFTTSKFSPAFFAGKWALDHPNEKIGMTSSGTAEFIADNVVNLDGKVNFDALKARKNYHLGQYVASSGITVLIDWDYFANMIIPEARQAGANFVPVDSITEGLLIYRKSENK